MTRAAGGMAIAIDFGEITTGLSAILGMGKGMTSEKHLEQAVQRLAKESTGDFGRFMDARGASGEIAHVYEYGREGNPAGRLWKLHWQGGPRGMVANVQFRTARRPTQVGAGIDERLAADAAAAGRTLAQHYFPMKATVLENTKRLVSEPGKATHTRRLGGDVASPRVLVYIGRDGKTAFSRRYARTNEFHGKFQAAFAQYWATKIGSQGAGQIETAFKRTGKFGEQRLNQRIRAASIASRPRLPAGFTGILATDRGRPYRGVRLRETEVRRVENAVGDVLRKELNRAWSR